MKIIKAKVIVIIFAVIASLFLVRSASTSASTQLTIDVNRILADVSHKPFGIGLNFISDRPNIAGALQDIRVGSLRFATNEYYLFDRQKPNNPQVSIQDPNLWQVKNFSKPDGTWWSKLSFDEFMSLCRATNAEPFVVIGIDAIAYSGDALHATPEEVLNSAVEWVRYANIDRGYGVKHWEIGNESNLNREGSIVWTPEQYAQTVVQFSRAMKAVDPTIKIGANGMRIKENDDWWSQIMPIIKDDIDFSVTHQYSWQTSYQEWKNAADEYDYNILDAIEAIETYNPSLTLNITEISAFNPDFTHKNNTWKMLHNFEMLGQTLRFKQVDYVHFWTSRWLETDAYAEDNSAFDADYKLSPIGYPLKVWNTFLQPKIVDSTKAAGTIRSWASYNPDNGSLSVFLLNKDLVSQNVSAIVDNYYNSSNIESWVLKGSSPESIDVSWNQTDSVTIANSQIKAVLEPLSITAIVLK